MLCNDWPGTGAAYLSHISAIQKIPRGWQVAPGPKQPSSTTMPRCTYSLSQHRSEHWSDTVRGCQSHTWMSPRARAANSHSATCAAQAQGPWSSGGIRAGLGTFHCCILAKQQGELSLNLGNRGSWSSVLLCPRAGWTLDTGWLPSLLPGEGRMETGRHGGNQLPFPIPCPGHSHSESPQMTYEEKSDSISEKRGWN